MCASVFCEEGTGGSAPGLEKGQSHRVLLLLKHVYCADMRTWVQMPNGHIKKARYTGTNLFPRAEGVHSRFMERPCLKKVR